MKGPTGIRPNDDTLARENQHGVTMVAAVSRSGAASGYCSAGRVAMTLCLVYTQKGNKIRFQNQGPEQPGLPKSILHDTITYILAN